MIGYGTLILFVVIIVIYNFITPKLMSRPFSLVILGFILCVFAGSSVYIFDFIISMDEVSINKEEFKLLKSIFSLSIASLGGGIICSGFILKAQIEHNKEEGFLKKRLLDIKNLNENLKEAKINKGENWTDEDESAYVYLLMKNHFEEKEIVEELELKSQIKNS